MSSLCSFRLDKVIDGRRLDVLIVFLAADELRHEELTNLIDNEVQGSLAPDEMILLVRRTSFSSVVSRLDQASEFEATRNRLGRSSISVIGFGAGGNEVSRTVVREGDEISGMPVVEIGRRCASRLFHHYGGFVEANANYHFLNPSERHTDRFIRLSNLLVSSAEISLLAMTVLPLMPADAQVAHVDTPAMFAIVSAINDHLRVLAPTRDWLRCENFRSYLEVLTHNFTDGGVPVVLISASSSGSLGSIIAGRNVATDRIGHVLYLGKQTDGVRYAVDLSFDEQSNPEGIADNRATFNENECELCAAGSKAIPLKGDQFDLGGPDFEPLTMRKTDAPAGLSATMGRIVGSGALQVTTTRGAGSKQYFIAITDLLNAELFAERVRYVARRYVPSMIKECVVLDESSRVLAERVMADAGVQPRYMKRDDLDDLDPVGQSEDGQPLDGMPVVMIAGVIESGRSLREISRDLRRARPRSPQIYIVGCAKNASAAHRDELEKTLIQTHEAAQHAFATAEEIILPPSGTPHAWLAEIDFLSAAAARGLVLGEALGARLTRLNQASEPLVNDLFVAVGDHPLQIQPGFVFWPPKASASVERPSSQADVYFTVASVLQALRTNPPNPEGRALRTNWFQQTRLDPANLGRFSDGVIQASILRAARPVEIDYSTQDDFARDAGRAICRIMEAAHKPRGEAACEVLIAIGSRRLRLPKPELERVLQLRPTFPPLVDKLAAVCRAVLL